MNRRSFFKGLATAIAIVAMAPEIAFNRRLPLRNYDLLPFWVEANRITCFYSEAYVAYMQKALRVIQP